ncbi:MAG: hypothetical protein D6760_07440 [Deltaproteobacteria bacterium]|nr:MAG: hypothetical protein D6760_07440 [Deltaproteobacteria bacterium]
MLERELDLLAQAACLRRMGLVRPSAAGGRASVELPFSQANTNTGGNLHGGAIATAAVVAARLAAASTERSDDAERRLSVVHQAISYLDSVRNEDVTARARVLRRGRDTVHVTADLSAGTRAVATALIALRVGTTADESTRRAGSRAAAADSQAVQARERARLAISPFLTGAAMEVVATDPPWVCGRLPLEGNDGGEGRVCEGMLATLADFCGALASYAGGRIHRRRGGATVALSLAVGYPPGGDVFGAARLIAREGTSFTSTVELWPADSAELCAAGTVSYRIGSPGAPID